MDDYLISVLEQKDQLADELHARTNAYAEIKAKLGMAEFENERLLAEVRAQVRTFHPHSSIVGTLTRRAQSRLITKSTSSDGVDGGDDAQSVNSNAENSSAGSVAENEMGETLETVRAERDKLASSLAEMNRTMQQLRDRMGGDERTLRESERRRRKDAHKSSVSIRAKAQLDELDKENKRLTAEIKRCERAEEQVRELKEQIASKESMLRDRDAAVTAADEELTLLRSLIGSVSSERSSASELEAKIAEAQKATARAEGERDAAASAHSRERDSLNDKVTELTTELNAARQAAGDASATEAKLAAAMAATARAEADRDVAIANAEKEQAAMKETLAKATADLQVQVDKLTAELEATRQKVAEAKEAHEAEVTALKNQGSNAKSLLAAAEVETAKAALLRSQCDSVRQEAEAEVNRIHDLFLKEQERFAFNWP